MAKSTKQKVGSSRKVGRSKRPTNQAMSSYVRGRITFEQYQKRTKS